MSVTLKTSKPRMFSTVLDVIRRGRIIRTENLILTKTDPSYNAIIVRDGEVESFIQNQDGIILAYLNDLYGGAEGLRTTRWVTSPFADPENLSKGILLTSTLADTTNPYTAYWKVRFTSTTAFTVTSSLEGSQGTGSTANDFTSTNLELTLGTNAWVSSDAGFTAEDKFYFSVIDVYQIVNKLSADLAAAAILRELYSETVPNASEYAGILYRDAIALLDKLVDPESGVSITSGSEFDLSSTAVDYRINSLGEDDSGYLTENELDP